MRKAINQALGRGAMDQLNRGELAKLTSLNIANQGITSLTGLEYAINLTSLNAANNSIADATPIQGLTTLISVNLNGNPCPGCTVAVQVPVPDWALIVLSAFLLTILRRNGRAINRLQQHHLGALVIAAAALHSPGGFAQSVPANPRASALAPHQSERLQQLSGQILQAYAVREKTLKQEADTLRAQLQPLQDGLAALENQITQDISRSNKSAGSPVKQLTILSRVDRTPKSIVKQAQSLAPYKQTFPSYEVAGTQVVDIKATFSDNNPQVSRQVLSKRGLLLEHIAALRGGQLAATKVIDRKLVENQLDDIRDRLETINADPGQALAKVKGLRKSLNPPEPPPYVLAEPTYIAAPDRHLAAQPDSSNRKQTRK